MFGLLSLKLWPWMNGQSSCTGHHRTAQGIYGSWPVVVSRANGCEEVKVLGKSEGNYFSGAMNQN